MQLKVYVYSAFKASIGHLPNKNVEVSDSRMHLCPASIGGDWDWLRRGPGVKRRSTRRPERSSARMHAGLRLCWDLESAADSLYVVARDNRVQKERSAVLQTEEATKG
jgi:hypothetical protein